MARILVVDDEEGIREFLSEVLELDGHEVTQAPDGQAALDTLKGNTFDVVLTDLTMPHVDGHELLTHIKTHEPTTEVIVLTAHGSVERAVEAMRVGAFDFLQKPVGSPEELSLVVARALERRALRNHAEAAERDDSGGPPLTYGAPSMTPLVDALGRVAKTDATVLLLGESGTGKEVTAKTLHRWSARAEAPFVAINCAAISAQLLESELFGHEKGAFTGATSQRRGRIELAEGGTFFLDEIGEMAMPLQAKLLRVLEERTFERVGGSKTLPANVRWVAATNRDLSQCIAEGTFREDLYHRLAVFPLRLPALRERREDIRPLAKALLAGIAANMGRPGLNLSEEVLDALAAAKWPGNVRQLRNTLERAAILASGEVITPAQLWFEEGLPAATSSSPTTSVSVPDAAGGTLQDMERAAIAQALEASGGNRKQAAEQLGIGVRTLYEKLKRYDLR